MSNFERKFFADIEHDSYERFGVWDASRVCHCHAAPLSPGWLCLTQSTSVWSSGLCDVAEFCSTWGRGHMVPAHFFSNCGQVCHEWGQSPKNLLSDLIFLWKLTAKHRMTFKGDKTPHCMGSSIINCCIKGADSNCLGRLTVSFGISPMGLNPRRDFI